MLKSFAAKLGLDRPELRAWALYDWANSAFITTIAAILLPIYYADVAAADLPEHLRTAYWGYTSGIGLLLVSVCAPILGAMSDALGSKKKFIAAFMFLGVTGCVFLFFVGRGDWMLASAMFILGNVGFAGGNVFYEALLPEIAKDSELDKVSTAGYALGYVGGGLLMAINLAWIQMPDFFGFADKGQAVRFSFVSVAIWWVVFSIPLFRTVKEVAPVQTTYDGFWNLFKTSFGRLRETAREIRSYKQVVIFLVAFWIYMDGIGTIIKMATIYGREIGIAQGQLIGAMLLVQFLGIPFTFAFIPIAEKFGAKRGIMFALCIYMVVCIFGYYMTTALHFWMLAIGVGMAQGGCQALSRSVFASIIPKNRSAEFFGFFSVSSKFAGVFGPLFFGGLTQLVGGGRFSILFLVVFFIAGILILSKLDVEEGRRRVAGL